MSDEHGLPSHAPGGIRTEEEPPPTGEMPDTVGRYPVEVRPDNFHPIDWNS